jgi:hypothetical protein
MASGHTGRTLTTHPGSMGEGRAPTDYSSTGISGRTRGRSWNAKQKVEGRPGNGRSDAKPVWAAVIGQWTFFVLGVLCMVCGVFGVFAQRMEGPLSASVAWLGRAYVPALRVTALLCVFMGSLLVRRGWSSHDRAQKGNEDERRP